MKKLFCLFASTIFLASGALGSVAATTTTASTTQTVDSDADIIHVLNRVTFGPRPGDIERVRQLGIQKYIEEQLNPRSMVDPVDSNERYQSLKQSPMDLIRDFQTMRKEQQKFKKEGENASDDQKQAAKQALKKFYLNTEGAYKSAKLARAVDSPRQLQEVMTDFWYNHFNVYTGKGLDRVLCGPYEEQAIRPFVLGKFRDILGATCHHPAMLFYLDNWQNTVAKAPNDNGPAIGKGKGKATGLNENYARELMELHTLGVDGGYSQKDVIELARILTGLGLTGPRYNRNPNVQMIGPYGAAFAANRHDFNDKVLLGHRIAGSGEGEVEEALDILSRQPATAHHIAFQLAQYFVADSPPPQLVNKLAQRFLQTDGNIKDVMQTLLSSQEFWNPKYEHTKYKSPFRYVISSIRAAGIEPDRPELLNAFLQQQGQPIYGCLTPDGYKNTKEAWMNPDALLRRINFATAIGTGNLAGVKFDAPEYRTLGATISAGKFSTQTVTTIAQQPEELRSALLIGSPEFMRY